MTEPQTAREHLMLAERTGESFVKIPVAVLAEVIRKAEAYDAAERSRNYTHDAFRR